MLREWIRYASLKIASRKKTAMVAAAAGLIAILLRTRGRSSTRTDNRAFSHFLSDLRENRVQSIMMRGDVFQVILKAAASGSTAGGAHYETNVVPFVMSVIGPEIFGLISRNAVKMRSPSKVSVRMLRNQYSSKNEVGKKKPRHPRNRNFPRFADVAGIDAAKVEMQEVVSFLRDSTKYRRMGAKLPKGILLWGPSGTGKTLLAKAVAAEANVAFFSCSASDFVEMLVGRGAARVRDLFQRASKHDGPAIVFIDELDALGKARGGLNSHDEREQTLNQLLTEMDGFDSSANASSPVLVIAATNRPQVLDSALTRPGRFDRHVHVGVPDENGREAVLRVHARRVKLGTSIDFRAIARRTTGRTGAELACLVNEAALLSVRSGKGCVDQASFDMALRRGRRVGS